MLETHGWISVAMSTDGEGEENIMRAIEPLISMVNAIRSEQSIIDIRPLNGRYFICITNHPNHMGVEFDNVMMLVQFIANKYKGSYGLIYVRNDEDEFMNDNSFVIYKLARGKITMEQDCLLSPCNPVIED